MIETTSFVERNTPISRRFNFMEFHHLPELLVIKYVLGSGKYAEGEAVQDEAKRDFVYNWCDSLGCC